MSFSENLTRERKARGLSQEDLAAKIQVSRQAVSKWETGEAMPDLTYGITFSSPDAEPEHRRGGGIVLQRQYRYLVPADIKKDALT